MHVRFERTGGFAGISLKTIVDTTTLSADQRHELETLVTRADFFALPPTITGPSGGADRFHYRIAIEADGREHVVEVGEASVPPSLRPLIDWLTAIARRAPGPR